MKILSNVHTHCNYCDGTDTPEDVVRKAISLGFTDLGFSSHSPAPYDPSCPGVASEIEYRREIARLHDKYEGEIHILCGMETDTYAPVDRDNYDYIIGSNHFLPAINGQYTAVDGDFDAIMAVLQASYGGNALAMAGDYFQLQLRGIQEQQPDIVGHFDLLKKYNRDGRIFDEDDPQYRTLAAEALDNVLNILDEYGGMVEVNTGAMARGLRDDPYPSLHLLKHAAQRNARMIIASDSHKVETLNAYFDDAQALLKQAGFRWMMVLKDGRFQQVAID